MSKNDPKPDKLMRSVLAGQSSPSAGDLDPKRHLALCPTGSGPGVAEQTAKLLAEKCRQ